MLVRRKDALSDFTNVTADCVNDLVTEMLESLDELGRETRIHTEEIVADQNLPITGRPGADSDRWNVERGATKKV